MSGVKGCIMPGIPITVDGITFPSITKACEYKGISHQLFNIRRRRGKSTSEALEKAKDVGRPRQKPQETLKPKPFLKML